MVGLPPTGAMGGGNRVERKVAGTCRVRDDAKDEEIMAMPGGGGMRWMLCSASAKQKRQAS